MLTTLSATCVAIAAAHKAGTLRIYEREGRFGIHAVIADHVGVIETPDSLSEERRDIERRWNRRHWTGADYATHDLIAANID